ncbi:hypothetical protein [Acinetobacter bereziniae]|uniref:hypothetical protein n=1 Tax=Acinetobacter bereziniae TaxID=106648 RepID=UPI0032B3AB0D
MVNHLNLNNDKDYGFLLIKSIKNRSITVKDQLGEEYGKQVLNSGMKEFDRHVNKDGKESSCKYVLEKFPDYVWK